MKTNPVVHAESNEASLTRTSQKIVPHLWFDTEAKKAAEFYASIFPDSKITYSSTLSGTPSGDTEIVSFELSGQQFMAISAGPLFKFTPAISFHVRCKSMDEVDLYWEKLSNGGKVLMELGEYPYSKRYGWVQDAYGLSWQIIFVGTDGDARQKIVPALLFVGDVCGKAEEAITFYASVFRNAKANVLARYGAGEGSDAEGTVKFATLTIEGQQFGAMDSAAKHAFTFNEAISFVVMCDTQQEVDYYWDKLSAVPEAEQCGWLKDRYGLSWQVVPSAMNRMLRTGSREQIARVVQALLKMKKFDIAELQRAFEG